MHSLGCMGALALFALALAGCAVGAGPCADAAMQSPWNGGSARHAVTSAAVASDPRLLTIALAGSDKPFFRQLNSTSCRRTSSSWAGTGRGRRNWRSWTFTGRSDPHSSAAVPPRRP